MRVIFFYCNVADDGGGGGGGSGVLRRVSLEFGGAFIGVNGNREPKKTCWITGNFDNT